VAIGWLAPSRAAEQVVVASQASGARSAAGQRPLQHGVFRWTSYPAAWTAAQQSQRPILVFVTSSRCPHCVRMLSQTFKDADVQQTVVDGFETVYVDRSAHPELVAKLGVRLFPTTVLVGANNKVMDRMEGYVDAAAFQRRVQPRLAQTGTAVAK
jgi:thioredoxin-like negative regulator of GroEL